MVARAVIWSNMEKPIIFGELEEFPPPPVHHCTD
jgi:hypothetical protein